MGYRPRVAPHPPHRRGRACPVCIARLEVEVGIRPAPGLPRPPAGPGGGSR